MLRTTPYTPVFPPPLRTYGSPASKSALSDSSIVTVNADSHHNKKPYIARLKERYILLASLPQNDLCPPSREASPGAEDRIEALRLRMRKARERGFPHDPELTLACSGVKGGDWIGEVGSDEENEGKEYVLPQTDEEWFQWERKKKAARNLKVVERKAAAHRQNIAKWTEGIEDDMPVESIEDGNLPQAPNVLRGSSIMKPDIAIEKVTTSRYFAQESLPLVNSCRGDSEPVERKSSPIPPASGLDPLPDFFDSFSIPSSPPSLPLPPDLAFPDDMPPSPSFAQTNVQTSTPRLRDTLRNPVFQLSSPVSPPRSSHGLAVSHSLSSLSSKRPREAVVNDGSCPDVAEDVPTTPRSVRKARILVQPITPASVPRQNSSAERTLSPSPQHLPTLTDLLASSTSRRALRARSRVSGTPRRDVTVVPEFSPSQPTYSTFRPQFQSTQLRAKSLPPSPARGRIVTSSQPSPQKSFGGSSSGMGFYQSQFNVERKVDQVAAFLEADVWDVET